MPSRKPQSIFWLVRALAPASQRGECMVLSELPTSCISSTWSIPFQIKNVSAEILGLWASWPMINQLSKVNVSSPAWLEELLRRGHYLTWLPGDQLDGACFSSILTTGNLLRFSASPSCTLAQIWPSCLDAFSSQDSQLPSCFHLAFLPRCFSIRTPSSPSWF